jgi:hypothetical protein
VVLLEDPDQGSIGLNRGKELINLVLGRRLTKVAGLIKLGLLVLIQKILRSLKALVINLLI